MTDIEFGKRFDRLMKDTKISNSYITEQAGISKNNVGNYKNGQIPNAIILYKLSQIFGVTMEYMLTGKEAAELTPEENRLIECYRASDPAGKDAIRGQAEYQASKALPEGVSASRHGKTGTDN